VFGDAGLNRRLYLWLAALAAVHQDHGHWVADNLAATQLALQRFPGLADDHRRLVHAHLAQRPHDDSPAEAAVRAALREGRCRTRPFNRRRWPRSGPGCCRRP
jgi:nitric oxide reductase NorD protein